MYKTPYWVLYYTCYGATYYYPVPVGKLLVVQFLQSLTLTLYLHDKYLKLKFKIYQVSNFKQKAADLTCISEDLYVHTYCICKYVAYNNNVLTLFSEHAITCFVLE